LGLAQQLQSLQIPQVIVMREPVPDVVAQNFLKYFLAEFSRGQSLYAAVRYARERLQGLEKEYPCATWLPVICQNPAVAPMIWSQSAKAVISTQSDKIRFQHSLSTLLIASVLVGTLVMGVRYLGVLQPWELQSYDHLMQLRSPDEKPDSRLLIVTIDEADIQYQIQQKMNLRWSLSDQAFNQLLQKLDSYQPKAIGIDIYHDFPFDRKYPALLNRLKKDDRLFAVCKVAAPIDKVKDGVPPPPEVPIQRQSFSDFVADEGDIARRQLLHLTPPTKSPCVAEHSFNFQLAQHYLNAQGIRWKINSNKNLQIGDVEFKELKSHTSGYQKFDASGYQILVNYRSLLSPQKIARQVALKDILTDQIKPELIESLKNRIVLIGVTASSSSDYWKTPYSSNAADNDKQIPGVFVQAQMISQILSAVIDKRPLLWWWSGWMEVLWIWGWSLLGGIIGWRIQQPFYLGLAIAIGLIAIFSICFSIFTLAGWIPLIPSALALIISAVVLKILPRSRNKKHLTS
jgi:CHASE2 domain-containing sensor protein